MTKNNSFSKPNPTPILRQVKLSSPDQYDTLAEHHLLQPDGTQAWECGNQYITCGRRAVKSFPRIMLSMPELSNVISEYVQAGIPKDRLRSAMMLIDAKLASYEAEGKSTERVCCYAWLIGWVKQQLLEDLIKQKRLEKISRW